MLQTLMIFIAVVLLIFIIVISVLYRLFKKISQNVPMMKELEETIKKKSPTNDKNIIK